MPRIARKDLDTTFFHIMVQGIEKKYIFEKEVYKKKYIELLFEKNERFNVNIIAYCIMDNHAHILLNIDKIHDMSDFMHNVNTLFAQYYNFMENNRVGYVFRDRFSSEAIYNAHYLLNCIRYIHNNPVNAKIVNKPNQYKYSSYRDYQNKARSATNKLICELIDINEVIDENREEDCIFLDTDINKENILKKVINKYEKDFNIPISEIIKNKYILRKMIKDLKENYKINYKQIAKEIGISKSTITRLYVDE